MASIVLLAVGILRVIRLLMAGEQPAVTAADASAPLEGLSGSAGGESKA
jgi:hypothetical protein